MQSEKLWIYEGIIGKEVYSAYFSAANVYFSKTCIMVTYTWMTLQTVTMLGYFNDKVKDIVSSCWCSYQLD